MNVNRVSTVYLQGGARSSFHVNQGAAGIIQSLSISRKARYEPRGAAFLVTENLRAGGRLTFAFEGPLQFQVQFVNTATAMCAAATTRCAGTLPC
jgi:hypothetical protein